MRRVCTKKGRGIVDVSSLGKKDLDISVKEEEEKIEFHKTWKGKNPSGKRKG